MEEGTGRNKQYICVIPHQIVLPSQRMTMVSPLDRQGPSSLMALDENGSWPRADWELAHRPPTLTIRDRCCHKHSISLRHHEFTNIANTTPGQSFCSHCPCFVPIFSCSPCCAVTFPTPYLRRYAPPNALYVPKIRSPSF